MVNVEKAKEMIKDENIKNASEERKVIEEHSTIGILITTDGSVTDIPRDDYIKAEERVVNELRALNKPFIILLNSANPSSPEARELALKLSNKYNTNVMPINCEDLTANDINSMFANLLYEFPVSNVKGFLQFQFHKNLNEFL